jgi:DNA-binding winged helix-turn-helix (wHTH) protein
VASVPGSLTYRFDDIELDPMKSCLRRCGQEIHLRAKTFQVLVYLVANRERVVSKDELLEQFWKNTAISEDVLAHSIAELRRVLGDSSREPVYLKTIPKRGYRFVGDVHEVPTEVLVATEQITTIQVREEYSEEPPARTYRWWPLVTILTIAGLSFWAARSPGRAHQPEWWEAAWWKLDEGTGSEIRDSVQGLTARLPAGVSWTEGILGRALLFTGAEGVVRGTDPGTLPRGNSPRTLAACIKSSATNGDSTVILFEGSTVDEGASDRFQLWLHESGTGAFGIGHFIPPGKTRIDDGRWHQLAGVVDGGATRRMRLYVDGMEDANVQHGAEGLKASTESVWSIGRDPQNGTSFRGVIDDVRIYERALRPDEVRGLYRCVSGADDIQIEGRGSYYFSPVHGNNIEILPPKPGEHSAGVRNTGKDFAGVTFVRRERDCALQSIHGSDMGQDLKIDVELLVPRGPGGAITDGGPYFRSRRANPGDGIIGGTSAGFWVHLDSTGQVRVQRLHPSTVLGFSSAPESFDPTVFHKLTAMVHGQTLEVALDGRPLTFDVAGTQQASLQLSPAWENASPVGHNGGAAGIAFSCSRNRGQQVVRRRATFGSDCTDVRLYTTAQAPGRMSGVDRDIVLR